jgi:hypothetical protein
MGEVASVISAASALVAIIFAIVIHLRTRNLMRRVERPVISLVKANVKPSLKTLHLFLEFKNIGKNPAMKVKIHMDGCETHGPLKLEKINSIHIVNQKDPGISFLWKVDVSPYEQGRNFIFYIEVAYQDIFTTKHYRSELWLMYRTGESELKDMDVTEYRKMKNVIEKKGDYRARKKFYEIIKRKEKT